MSNHHTLVQVRSQLVLTPYPWAQDKCVIKQNTLPTRCEKIHQSDAQISHQNHQVYCPTQTWSQMYHDVEQNLEKKIPPHPVEGRKIRLLAAVLLKCMSYSLYWMARGQLSTMRLLLLEAVEGAAIWHTSSMTTGQHQEAYMPTMHMLWRAVMVQTPVVEPWLVNMASTLEPESKMQTLYQTPM